MYGHVEVIRLFQNIGSFAEASATIALSVVFGLAMESAEPTIRNSNLFPVNAKVMFCFCPLHPSADPEVWTHLS